MNLSVKLLVKHCSHRELTVFADVLSSRGDNNVSVSLQVQQHRQNSWELPGRAEEGGAPDAPQ